MRLLGAPRLPLQQPVPSSFLSRNCPARQILSLPPSLLLTLPPWDPSLHPPPIPVPLPHDAPLFLDALLSLTL
jgi:hypothetical protein